ncbi:MAG: membrane dipeptidase [Bulleidia sp.]|nr:membrane dipeptidase [Bulleidia sp.]
MRIVDLHADLGWSVMHNDNALEGIHIPALKKGDVLDSAAACWFSGKESWKEMKEEILCTGKAIEQSDSVWIRSAEDLSGTEKKVSFLLTVEGMCGIDSRVKDRVDWMYEQGVRIASLTWNDANALANGVQGDPACGLSKKGEKAVAEMNALHMIIDVSHANEHTFWDILNASKKPVIATHSNARSLCSVERNLTDQQIIALCERGGIIGMNSCRRFISSDEAQQNAAGLARHARHIADIAGAEHIACGFDFMDFFPDEDNDNDIHSASQAQNFLKALKKEHFSKEEIEGIAWRNAFRFLKENM